MSIARTLSIGRWLRAHWWPESGAINSIPALDGMRALAVLLVLAFHSWNNLPGYLQPGQNPYNYPINYGRTGVHLFFVLSGFLLFQPYARWIFGMQRQPSALLFYRRRALRIGPAYWACLLIISLVGPYTLAHLADVVLHAVFLSNITPQTTFTLNGVFWTMAIEVQFYVCLPLFAYAIFWLARRIGSWQAMVSGLVTLTALSLFATLLTKNGTVGTIPVISSLLLSQYSSLPFWLDVFAAGMACSALYVARRRIPRRVGTSGFVTSMVVGVTIVFVPVGHALPFKDFLFGWVYAGLLLGVLGGPLLLRRIFASRPMRFIGLTSYSFYLWHLLVLQVIVSRLIPSGISLTAEVILRFVIGLPLGILTAYVSFQCTERPFFRARRQAHESPPMDMLAPVPADTIPVYVQ